MIRPRFPTVALTIVLLAACGGESGSDVSGPGPADNTPASITFTTPAPTLDRWGDTIRLEARVLNAQGQPLTGQTIAWSSGDTAIARVSDQGTVTTWRAGEAAIEARVSGIRQSLNVTVAIQRNTRCVVPTSVPAKPAFGGLPAGWTEVQNPGETVQIQASSNGLVSADFDGDGRQDVIVFENTGLGEDVGRGTFLRNVGGTHFEDATTEVLGPESIGDYFPKDRLVADFNGDGAPDLYLNTSGFDAEPYPGAPDVYVLSRGDGTMQDVSRTAVSPNPADGFGHGADAADVDCDGDVDLILENIPSQTRVRSETFLMLNDGAGNLLKSSGLLPAEFVNGDKTPLNLASCDFDRDGDNDLIMGRWGSIYFNPDEDRDWLLINDGFGSFRQVDARLPAGFFGNFNVPNEVHCGDLDLDGWPDIVISSSTDGANYSTSDDHLAVWLNRGDLVFESVDWVTSRPEAYDPVSLFADINGDGWIDIFSNPVYTTGSLLINNGGTGFVRVDLPADDPSSFADDMSGFVDLDGDGRLDFIRPGGEWSNAPFSNRPVRVWIQR